MEDLRIEPSFPADGAVVVAVGGFVDTNTAPSLEQALTEHGAAAERVVVVDLEGVDYVSSAGWGVMVSLVSSLRDRGVDLRLAGMRMEVAQVYRLLEFPSILRAFDSVDDAIADRDAII